MNKTKVGFVYMGIALIGGGIALSTSLVSCNQVESAKTYNFDEIGNFHVGDNLSSKILVFDTSDNDFYLPQKHFEKGPFWNIHFENNNYIDLFGDSSPNGEVGCFEYCIRNVYTINIAQFHHSLNYAGVWDMTYYNLSDNNWIIDQIYFYGNSRDLKIQPKPLMETTIAEA